jgi:hypothetical protein
MSGKRELRDLLRRLIIAHGIIGQFVMEVATDNLSMDEAESLWEEVVAEAHESGGDGWMDLDVSAQRSHTLH